MSKAFKVTTMFLSILFLVSIVGCPKKAVKTEPIPPPPTPPEEKIEEPIKKLIQFQTIYFDFDKSDIRPADAEVLKSNANLLKDNPGVNIIIEGHCCPLGTSEYNMALGWRRATSAQNYLIKLGIDKARLSTISYGEERLVTNNPDEFWKNRRCEFIQK